MTHAHMGIARAAHDGADVGEVEVDEAGVFDEAGNAGDGLMQHLVRNLKGVGERDLLVCGVFQAVVRDDKEAVHAAEKLVDTLHGLLHALASLKAERLCDDADGEDVGLMRNVRDRRRSARARAAAHTGGDEDHIGILHALGKLVPALLGSLLADGGVTARALSMRQLFADLDLLIRRGHCKRLLVRIDRDKLHTAGAGADHPVDDVVAGAADSDDLQRYNILRAGLYCMCCHIISLPCILSGVIYHNICYILLRKVKQVNSIFTRFISFMQRNFQNRSKSAQSALT